MAIIFVTTSPSVNAQYGVSISDDLLCLFEGAIMKRLERYPQVSTRALEFRKIIYYYIYYIYIYIGKVSSSAETFDECISSNSLLS